MQRINLKKNLIKVLLILQIALLLVNCVLTFLNGNIIEKNNALRKQTEQFDLRKRYETFYKPLFSHEDTLSEKAEGRYLEALTDNRLIMIVLLLIGVPTMIYIIMPQNKNEKRAVPLNDSPSHMNDTVSMTDRTDVLLSQCTDQMESIRSGIATLKKNIEIHEKSGGDFWSLCSNREQMITLLDKK